MKIPLSNFSLSEKIKHIFYSKASFVLYGVVVGFLMEVVPRILEINKPENLTLLAIGGVAAAFSYLSNESNKEEKTRAELFEMINRVEEGAAALVECHYLLNAARAENKLLMDGVRNSQKILEQSEKIFLT